MPRGLSGAWQRSVNSLSPRDWPLYLLEIDHPDLSVPIRVVNDAEDIVVEGEIWYRSRFELDPPEETERGLPSARLAVDNVGRGPDGNSIMDWLSVSAGGRGAVARVLMVRRSDPETIEWELPGIRLGGVHASMLRIQGRLGWEDYTNEPACSIRFRPDTHPGLF